MEDRKMKIDRLEKEIEHLIEFGDLKEIDSIIGEKTKELVRLQLETMEEKIILH